MKVITNSSAKSKTTKRGAKPQVGAVERVPKTMTVAKAAAVYAAATKKMKASSKYLADN